MSRRTWCAARPRGVRLYALLVLTVLAGLVAMHGLGPAVPPAPGSAAPEARHAVTGAPAPGALTTAAPAAASHTGAAGGPDCAHAGHGEDGAGGHVEHADSTCAAGGTSGAPATAPPAQAGVIACPAADVTARVPAVTRGGRAPPSLSELQLLRI